MPTSNKPPESSQPPQVNYDPEATLSRIEIEEKLKAVDAHKRLEVCQECDKYIKLARICSECKCFMPLKTRFKLSKCPLEKW